MNFLNMETLNFGKNLNFSKVVIVQIKKWREDR